VTLVTLDRHMTRWRAYALVAAVCALPRLAVLIHERGAILASFTEKSLEFAQTFVSSGTFGFIAGVPSANTQPLYAFFLIPLVWLFGQSWLAVGLAQIGLAIAVALLVYEIGRRVTTPGAAILGAVIATLQPYLVWHDVHINREIVDQLLGAAMVLLALVAVSRRTVWPAVALGAVSGLAILSNTRLLLLPLLLAGYLLWGKAGVVASAAVVVAAALVIAPWAIRNRVQVGCFTITTDSRALWKANNPYTYRTLADGKWIDDVPPLAGAPPWPELVADERLGGKNVPLADECAQMHLYDHQVFQFWRHHPGEKLKLMAQATLLLWQPSVFNSEGGPSQTGTVQQLRSVVEPLWVVPVYLLAIAGLWFVPRTFVVLALGFVGYETFAAWVFAGTTRYRVAWDFVLAVLAAAAIARVPFRSAVSSAAVRLPFSQNR
jgi:4-amino-4-deoxy-L-arabinose transferase-like glycosyltransferase